MKNLAALTLCAYLFAAARSEDFNSVLQSQFTGKNGNDDPRTLRSLCAICQAINNRMEYLMTAIYLQDSANYVYAYHGLRGAASNFRMKSGCTYYVHFTKGYPVAIENMTDTYPITRFTILQPSYEFEEGLLGRSTNFPTTNNFAYGGWNANENGATYYLHSVYSTDIDRTNCKILVPLTFFASSERQPRQGDILAQGEVFIGFYTGIIQLFAVFDIVFYMPSE